MEQRLNTALMPICFLAQKLSKQLLTILIFTLISENSICQTKISYDSLDVLKMDEIEYKSISFNRLNRSNIMSLLGKSLKVETYFEEADEINYTYITYDGIYFKLDDQSVVGFGLEKNRNNYIQPVFCIRNKTVSCSKTSFKSLFPDFPMLKRQYEAQQAIHEKERLQGKKRSVINDKTDDRYFIKVRGVYKGDNFTNRIMIDVKGDKIQTVSGDLIMGDNSDLDK